MCFCRITPTVGTILIAFVQFVTAICTLVWIFLGISSASFGPFLLTVTISTVVNLLIPLTLVLAVLRNKDEKKRIMFFRIWLSWEVAFLLYLLISVVYVALFQWEYSGEGFNVFALSGISFFLHCYFLYTIFNFYEKTLLEREDPLPKPAIPASSVSESNIPTRTVIHTEI